ncbi:hypothetical protein GSI_06144 [Ganoderma sinense ZZ0214-1]|uniref:Uncharacterized protein n=1 Tax=Ganoderma sinense ZZ0214-1 TaxID=1077348 RepID=A0A2G8SCH1_9APHY|nr:hypothetical protein GSI_06144 [Ganoderma sinense ZZ0214-1]
MEEFQLPKTERFYGRFSQPSYLGEGQSLSAFISPLLRLSQADCSFVPTPNSPTSLSPSHISMSMLGQPPTEASNHDKIQIRVTDRGDVAMSSDDSFTFATKTVERACGGFLGGNDPYSLILEEKVDEKDEHLMNVPTLPPPNEHESSTCLPTRLADLVVPAVPTAAPEGGPSAHCASYTGFLKRAKGLQSLQLELSWIPFKYGRTVPTDEEVADVADDISAQLVKTIELPQDDVTSRLSELLDDSLAISGGTQPESTALTPSAAVWFLDDECDFSVSVSESFEDGIGLVLTRSDRMRLAGLCPLVDRDHDEDTGSNDDENTKDNDPGSPRGRPTKRVRFQDINDLEEATRTIFEEVIHETAYSADEFFAPQEPHVDAGSFASSFTQMAYDAEGFDGPAADGNLFLDMDLIHCGGDVSDSPCHHLPESPTFPVPLHSHSSHTNHVFASASPEQSQIIRINELTAADDLSPGQPLGNFRRLPSAPLGCGPLSSNVIVPAAISHISLNPHPATEAMVTEECLSAAVHTSSAATSVAPAINISARESLVEYLTLRGKTSVLRPDTSISAPPCAATHETSNSGNPVHLAPIAPLSDRRCAPAELVDHRTLIVPGHFPRPETRHTYMASLSLVQKRSIVRALGSHCAVDLVEREHLGDSSTSSASMSGSEDLVLDCDTAVLFPPLELLPARAAELLALLCRLSWRYAHILVVFECYPSACDYSLTGDAARAGADRLVASVWSAPVVRAVRNLRRDLAISEGLQTKCETCLVEYAFANSPEEAAVLARRYGDLAEARDTTGGDAWGRRLWLTDEERDVSALP